LGQYIKHFFNAEKSGNAFAVYESDFDVEGVEVVEEVEVVEGVN